MTVDTVPSVEERFAELGHLVGNTPLLAIRFQYAGESRRIFAKAENLNMTGSIKDRMALHIIRSACGDGTLSPGAVVVEATSGNTGISFASIARSLGHPVVIFMPDWMSMERRSLIESLGATVIPVSREEGGFRGSVRKAEEYAEAHRPSFLPRQFSNERNVEAHAATTGPEIWHQLRSCNLAPDAFVAGVGTGGTIMGVGRFLRSVRPAVKLHPLEPASSPTLSTGYKTGTHRIQGISDEFIPPVLKLDALDRIVSVDDGDAIIMAQSLACELGLAVGISSGANFLGALQIQNEMDRDAVVVTVFADDNKKYLSTDLMRKEPVKERFLSPQVKLESFRAINRVCELCGVERASARSAPA